MEPEEVLTSSTARDLVTTSPNHEGLRHEHMHDRHVKAASAPVDLTNDTLSDGKGAENQAPSQERGYRFWLIIVSLFVATCLCALDLTSVSTALPTIVDDLHGNFDFVWVGSAFALGSTVFIPLAGGIAQIFGRRPVTLASLVLFALGSALCGAAHSMRMLIAGRTVQGLGAGGITSLTSIIVGDLVSLQERGKFVGMLAAVWAVSAAIGPPIGGAFSQSNWRWLFYMNLPISGIAIVLVVLFLNLKTPRDTFWSKVKRMDWIGNIIIIGSSTIVIVALTWAGISYSWSSVHVLVPLILGFVGLAAFLVYEDMVAVEPVVPWRIVSNRTSALGYLTTFLHGILATAVVYFLPIYFQGVLLQSPVGSGVSSFGNAMTISPSAIVAGISVTITGRYWWQNLLGWVLAVIGIGLLSVLDVGSPKAEWVIFQMIEGIGLGTLYTVPQFPCLAPLPVPETARALALVIFFRSLSQAFGVTIGATILRNELKHRLPQELLSQYAEGVEIAYAIIPTIKAMAEPLQSEVRSAFADSLKVIWYVMAGIGGVGSVCIFGMKELSLHRRTDENWGIEEK